MKDRIQPTTREGNKEWKGQLDRITKDIAQDGFAHLEDTYTGGIFLNYGKATKGMEGILMHGDELHYPTGGIKTRGRHIAFDPKRLELLSNEEFKQRQSNGTLTEVVLQDEVRSVWKQEDYYSPSVGFESTVVHLVRVPDTDVKAESQPTLNELSQEIYYLNSDVVLPDGRELADSFIQIDKTVLLDQPIAAETLEGIKKITEIDELLQKVLSWTTDKPLAQESPDDGYITVSQRKSNEIRKTRPVVDGPYLSVGFEYKIPDHEGAEIPTYEDDCTRTLEFEVKLADMTFAINDIFSSPMSHDASGYDCQEIAAGKLNPEQIIALPKILYKAVFDR
jgi:hypothetical protein